MSYKIDFFLCFVALHFVLFFVRCLERAFFSLSSSFWFVLKSDRSEHSTTSECKIFTLTHKIHRIQKDSRRWYCRESFLTRWIRVEVNSDMHFYPAMICFYFFPAVVAVVPRFGSFSSRNFLGLFNERKDLIYWFPLNTHWESTQGNKLWVLRYNVVVFSCVLSLPPSRSLSLSLWHSPTYALALTEGVKIQFCDLKYDSVCKQIRPVDVAKKANPISFLQSNVKSMVLKQKCDLCSCRFVILFIREFRLCEWFRPKYFPNDCNVCQEKK